MIFLPPLLLQDCKKVFSEITSPNLKVLIDPVGYFGPYNMNKMDEILDSIFDELSNKIVIAHAKDVRCIRTPEGIRREAPAPGLGKLDYPHYLKRLLCISPNIPLIIEHLTEEDVPRAKKFIDQMLLKVRV